MQPPAGQSTTKEVLRKCLSFSGVSLKEDRESKYNLNIFIYLCYEKRAYGTHIWSDILPPDANKHSVMASKANLERLCKWIFLYVILLLSNHEDYNHPFDATISLWIL